MTWLIIRLILSLAFIGGVLWFAARVAKKRGIGGTGNGVIEVLARQRMGRASTVNVVRIADMTLVVGATEEQITLLAEVDGDAIDAVIRERDAARSTRPVHAVHAVPDGAVGEPVAAGHRSTVSARNSGAFSGSVFDRNGWGSFVNQLRERTVRRP
jgi:flagellar protein FliO/FliZ